MALLVISETLGLFLNRLTADVMYFLRNKQNLQQSIQMESSKIQRIFPESFQAFLKSTSSIELLNKKMTLLAYGFPKFWAVKDVVRKMSKKPRFRTSFDSQLTKLSQTLLKSAGAGIIIFFLLL